MKYLITLLCIVILSIAGIQQAQAQTKEETIAWLNTNGRSLFYYEKEFNSAYSYQYFEKVEGDYLIFKNEWMSKENDIHHIKIYKILISSILYEDVNTLSLNEKAFCFKVNESGYDYILTDREGM